MNIYLVSSPYMFLGGYVAKWTVSVSDELDRRFREAVFRLKGLRRGALKEALEEAIRLWLEKYESTKGEHS